MTAVEFEDILSHAGGRGRWQWLIFGFASLSGFFNAFHHLCYVFLGATPDHWCALPDFPAEFSNMSLEQLKNISIPKEIRKGKEEFSRCLIYDRNYSSILQAEPPDFSTNLTILATKTCDQWNYDFSEYTSSIVTEVVMWNLVCQFAPLLSTVQATYMAGVFVGCFLYGMASDSNTHQFSYSRLMSRGNGNCMRIDPNNELALPRLIWQKICNSLGSHIFHNSGDNYVFFISLHNVHTLNFPIKIGSPTYSIFRAPSQSRRILSLLTHDLNYFTHLQPTEIADPTMRCMFGIFFEIPFAVGYMTLSGVAYLIRDWRHLQLAISIPNIFMITYIWLLPESPRWLISKGKFDQALKVLKKAAKLNGKTLLPDNEMLCMMKACKENYLNENYLQEEKSKHSQLENYGIGIYFSLFHRRGLRRILTIYFTFVVSMVYYGIAINVKNLDVNVYLINFFNGAVEIPAYIFVYFLIMSGGRRFGYCGTFLAGGFACLLILVVESKVFEFLLQLRHFCLNFKIDFHLGVWLVITLSVVDKFCITATFAISYLFTAELFPTSVRNVALTSSSMCGRIGSILAPFIVDLVKSDAFNVPMALFGGLSVAAGILALLLPETNNRNMVENWSKSDKTEVADAGESLPVVFASSLDVTESED
uniref:Major facilitator superfamily (MFS) profile domain-containing protein n=1 Tax=Strigamia maritima TaxID=126957 RepID=T1JCC2_STRMM